MFNLFRHYAIASFVGVLAAATLLTAVYRHLEVEEASESARRSNLTLAGAVVESVRPELGDYLGSVANLGREEAAKTPLPPALASAINGFVDKASIAKVRIYNNLGVIVYSTSRRETGTVDAGNEGFASARTGQAFSSVAYRDSLAVGELRSAEDNLVRTFVPVRNGAAGEVRGAFATYVDLGAVVAQNEREVLQAATGIVLVLLLLYAALLVVVMHARVQIDAQQETIRERSATLEKLSVQLLAGEESEKSSLAANLHEGLAQTLTAIKTRIQYSMERLPAAVTRDASLNTALWELQGAIEDVQEMATDLRPPSLDELGLVPTIRWLCREFEVLHPEIRIDQQISLEEPEIPEPLKIVIYRIIEAVLKDIGNNPHKDRIRLSLRPDANAITLAIDDIPEDQAPSAAALAIDTPRQRFAAAQERATLSGGAFSAVFNREGGITLNASWAM